MLLRLCPYSQISTARGFMKLKSRVGFPLGILNNIEIPRFMKGFVKSITDSRAKLMVIAPTAMSALRSINSLNNKMVKVFNKIFKLKMNKSSYTIIFL